MSPQSIQLNPDSGLLTITWEDSSYQELSSSLLRRACQCAICKADRINGKSPVIPDSVMINEINPVGTYGIQLIFNDGHDRGIYPWLYLQTLPLTN